MPVEDSERADGPGKDSSCVLVPDTSSPGGHAGVLRAVIFSVFDKENKRSFQATCKQSDQSDLSGQFVDNLSSRLTIGIKKENTPLLPPTQTQTLAAWDVACVHLQQKLSEDDFELWIKPIHATQTETGLRLDYPDRFTLAYAQERFGHLIRESLQHTGITEFYFSFGEKAIMVDSEK